MRAIDCRDIQPRCRWALVLPGGEEILCWSLRELMRHLRTEARQYLALRAHAERMVMRQLEVSSGTGSSGLVPMLEQHRAHHWIRSLERVGGLPTPGSVSLSQLIGGFRAVHERLHLIESLPKKRCVGLPRRL